jgi:hypothetical protein
VTSARASLDGTLDAHSRADLDRMSAGEAAVKQYNMSWD